MYPVLPITISIFLFAGLVPEQQRLIFAGQVLSDESTLQHFSITAQHTLQLAPRMGASQPAAAATDGSAAAAAVGSAATDGNTAAAAPSGAAELEEAENSDGVLVVSNVQQIRDEVAHGASQMALYVVAL